MLMTFPWRPVNTHVYFCAEDSKTNGIFMPEVFDTRAFNGIRACKMLTHCTKGHMQTEFTILRVHILSVRKETQDIQVGLRIIKSRKHRTKKLNVQDSPCQLVKTVRDFS